MTHHTLVGAVAGIVFDLTHADVCGMRGCFGAYCLVVLIVRCLAVWLASMGARAQFSAVD